MAEATNLEQLLARIDDSPVLKDAQLDPQLLARSLQVHDDNIEATISSLTTFIDWHQMHLGSSSSRVSIKQVHSFLRTGQLVLLPNSFDRQGNKLVLFTPDPSISPESLTFTQMYISYWFHQQKQDIGCCFIVNFKNFGSNEDLDSSYYQSHLDTHAVDPARPTNIRFLGLNNKSDAFGATIKEQALSYEFISIEQVPDFVNPAYLPVEFGGSREDWDVEAEVEDFIRERCQSEGLQYRGTEDPTEIEIPPTLFRRAKSSLSILMDMVVGPTNPKRVSLNSMNSLNSLKEDEESVFDGISNDKDVDGSSEVAKETSTDGEIARPTFFRRAKSSLSILHDIVVGGVQGGPPKS
ncbi:hypothetical protein BCR33DRAFT_852416 [Rhizoclosmatium globosum]|uniref:CRAL-TRIO domain-containing protein n=1 Tax=Rhizoclosmatium globosum TaxID=329046 RepID=A0A1Y2C1N7_9FUNG|nr:hypothetical protein BCR33DRAFT_852416 [Rhizoclosmatium globosum]|eukprot:ORY40939.1 hypothetical protein BCR33DRAFT_852416 [Rhizoclosmatium globosum]